ncbi:MAG: hypothetical protein Q9220_006894 [cf. Caloplaca sp. 1 TL-2023]
MQLPEGSKGVRVGSRIAVIAEADDDLANLSIPADDSATASSPQEDVKPSGAVSRPSESHTEVPPSPNNTDASRSSASSKSNISSKSAKQTYPLYPSIAGLLREKGLPMAEADKIPASGPKGRLLKGDVLAYIGRISQSYPSEQSARISKLSHLKLSKIQVATTKETPTQPSGPSPDKATRIPDPKPEPEPDTEVAVSISLKFVMEVQKRIQDTLGVAMPLSTFITRATEVANDELPRSAHYRPSADELFHQVLGLDKVNAKTSRGAFIPQITALPTTIAKAPSGPPKTPDIIDILTGTRSQAAKLPIRIPPPGIMSDPKSGPTTNVFSVSVSKGEEQRARVFLERVKTILQVEPGRLVI